MHLISPEYLELQKELHTNAAYGTSSDRLSADVLDIMGEFECKHVLDYGCGKGHLKGALGDIVHEYDPAIAGKDTLPEQFCDMVVCSDVMEHIEPDKLDAVLEHIQDRKSKIVFFVVSTQAAKKTLADGRNAHLIVENAEWWRKKIGERFDVVKWVDLQGGEVRLIARPYFKIKEIKGKGVVSDDERNEHVRNNCALVKRRVKMHNPIFPHKRVAILLCYGPSLEDTWGTAMLEKKNVPNADFVSVSGAHDYIRNRGITPKYHIECDPRAHKGDMLTKLHRDTEYLMASCCHPDVVNKLVEMKKKVSLWHLNNGHGSKTAVEGMEHDAVLVSGGGSVGLRAIPLLMMMGYRRFIVHGMDCSYRDEQTHAGGHTGKKTERVEIVCGGKTFVTAPVLLTYLQNFDDMRNLIGDPDKDPLKIEIILRGDGLLQHALKHGGAAKAGPMPKQEAA